MLSIIFRGAKGTRIRKNLILEIREPDRDASDTRDEALR